MASNIKIVGTILNTTTVSRYKAEDTNLISSRNLQENFGGENDYIEFYIYDVAGNLLNVNYNYLNYKLPPSTGLTPATNTQPNTTDNIPTENVGITSTLASQTSSLYPIIEIDPVKDLQDNGYSSGEFSIKYNFFTNRLSNYLDTALFIKEISPDRTEIRLASTTLTNDEIETVALSLIDKVNNSSYYVDYLVNFGNNEQYIAVNIALNKATTGYEVLFKLYEPLPLSVQEKQTLWVVEEKVSPYVFDINLDKLVTPPPAPTLKGPNFDIPISEQSQGTLSSPYTNYSTLVSNLQSLQNSSYQKVLNLLTSQSIDINVDYSDFNNFVFFGSAYQRVNNFYNKVKQIEHYNDFINVSSSFTSSIPSLITEINKYSSSINTEISQFDGYETYLYFESSSYAWPKINSNKPYQLLPIGSSTVTNWYNNLISSAKDYDEINYDNLEYAIPPFTNENEHNQPFLVFLNMVGHYFDNIWVYLKAITDINLANNNLEAGISKDLVYERLKSLGLKLYNSQAGESVDQFLIGANTGSSVFDNDFSITGSYINNIPRKDLVSELYKRIYHNLPLLLKTKGTVTGLENLITTFGLTGSILNVKEFGGGTKAELLKGYNNDKVRIVPNTIEGNVLSPLLSLQTYPTAAADFRDSDLHYIDISFSPQTQIDTYISGAIAATNPTWSLDDYIGDPRDQYSTTYPSLDDQRRLYFETGVPGFAPLTASAAWAAAGLNYNGSIDYNGFIRLIEYFDNSLFKMLEDFVPERASLSTGVTINSPVLERNKAVYANPTNTTTQSMYDADYDIANITPQYGSLFNNLGGDKKAFYDGNITGSIVDVGQYFEDNYNPYTGDWNVFNAQNPPTKSISLNSFLHSDWNILLNNVSQSVTSSYRQKIEYIWGTTGSITSSAELQDSYLSLRSYNTSRYEGSKLTSLLYNTYTPPNIQQINVDVSETSTIGSFLNPPITILSWFDTNPSYTNSKLIDNTIRSIKVNYTKAIKSIFPLPTITTTNEVYDLKNNIDYTFNLTTGTITFTPSFIGQFGGDAFGTTILKPISMEIVAGTYDGDKSYGTTAAIDRYSRKIGLFTQVATSSLLPKRNIVSLKYLVDEFGGLTELNQINDNWEDVQRTFKMSTTGSISLFDNKKYSNQKATDGPKRIFDSGYTYTPILYGKSNVDTKLYFDYSLNAAASIDRAINFSSSYYISGNPSLGYPYNPGTRKVNNLFNKPINESPNIKFNDPSQIPIQTSIYKAPESGMYNVDFFVNLSKINANSLNTAYSYLIYNLNLFTSSDAGNTWTDVTFPYKAGTTGTTGGSSIISNLTNFIYRANVSDVLYTFAPTSRIPQNNSPIPGQYLANNTGAGDYTIANVASRRSLMLNGVTYPKGSRFYLFPISGYGRGLTLSPGLDYDRIQQCLIGTLSSCIISPAPDNKSKTVRFGKVMNSICSSQSNYAVYNFTQEPKLLFDIPDFFSYEEGISDESRILGSTGKTLYLKKDDLFKIELGIQSTKSSTFSSDLNVIKNYPINTNFTTSLSDKDYFEVQASSIAKGIYPFATSSAGYFTSSSNEPDNVITLSQNLSGFYGSKYIFLPYYLNANDQPITSSLYPSYGNVDYEFTINVYDIFVAYDSTGFYFESRVIEVSKDDTSGCIQLKLADDMPQSIKSTLNTNAKFLFIKRVPDETSTYLTFIKRPGLTSYGLLIPDNLAPDILNNIDTITKQVKQKLLADQQGTTQ